MLRSSRWWNEKVKQANKKYEGGLFEVFAAADTGDNGEVPTDKKGRDMQKWGMGWA